MSTLLAQPVLAYLPLADLLKISLCSKEHHRVVREHVQTKTILQIPYETDGIRNNLSNLLPNTKKATIDIGSRYYWPNLDIPQSVTDLTILLNNDFLLACGELHHVYSANLRVLEDVLRKLQSQELKLTHLKFQLSPITHVTHKYKTGYVDKWDGDYEETVEYDHQMITGVDAINFWYYSRYNDSIYTFMDMFGQMITSCPMLQSCSLPEGFPTDALEPHGALLSFTPSYWISEESLHELLVDTFKDTLVRL